MEFPCPPYPILANISGENLLKRPPHASACLPSKQMAITAINPFIVFRLEQREGESLIKSSALMRAPNFCGHISNFMALYNPPSLLLFFYFLLSLSGISPCSILFILLCVGNCVFFFCYIACDVAYLMACYALFWNIPCCYVGCYNR